MAVHLMLGLANRLSARMVRSIFILPPTACGLRGIVAAALSAGILLQFLLEQLPMATRLPGSSGRG
jgi:hypothetical protein